MKDFKLIYDSKLYYLSSYLLDICGCKVSYLRVGHLALFEAYKFMIVLKAIVSKSLYHKF